MLKVEDAQNKILGHASVQNSFRLDLLDSWHYVLAEEVRSDTDLPSFDNSAVDGFAIRSVDAKGVSITTPKLFQVIGESHAGSHCEAELTEGSAVRIMTGAPIPKNADACVMVEDTRSAADNCVLIREAVDFGQHVRRSGEDVLKGDLVLRPGMLIGAAEIAMLAAAGAKNPLVFRKPRVAVVSTGDEVVDPASGTLPPYGKIRNSNLYALAAMVRESGAELHSMNHIPDDLNETESVFRKLSEVGQADVIVSAGGVSMGDRDYIKPALEKLGRLEFWKVAMKPGKPLAFGTIGNTLVFGLPGNPVSAMVTFELFVRPVIKKLAGRKQNDLFRMTAEGISSCDLAHSPGREEYIRAHSEMIDGRLTAVPTGLQSSGILSSMIGANSYIILAEESSGIQRGERVKIMFLC